MKILIVEDDSIQREVLRQLLEARFQQEAKLREADNLKTAFGYLSRGDIDCVVLDLQLPDSDGRDTFLSLHDKYPEIPIVVMTNNLDRTLALDMIASGAADYLIKNFTNDEEIFRRIVFAVERLRTGLKVPYDQLAEASRDEGRRKDPEAITKRPHAIATIHVPEVGPKRMRPALPWDPPIPKAPRAPTASQPPLSDPAVPPVELEIPQNQRIVEEKIDQLSARVDKLLLLLAVLLVAVVGMLWFNARRSGL